MSELTEIQQALFISAPLFCSCFSSLAQLNACLPFFVFITAGSWKTLTHVLCLCCFIPYMKTEMHELPLQALDPQLLHLRNYHHDKHTEAQKVWSILQIILT